MEAIEKTLQNQINKIDLKLEKIRLQYFNDRKKFEQNEDGDYTGKLYRKLENNERILNIVKENLQYSLRQLKNYD